MNWNDDVAPLEIIRYHRWARRQRISRIAEFAMWTVLGLLVVGLAVARSDTEVRPALKVKTNPSNFVMPRDFVRITVYVEPNDKNQELALYWYNSYPSGAGGVSKFDLREGAYITYTRLVRDFVPGGHLFVYAVLTREGGEEVRVDHVVQVLGE